jgi:hypothetical protein
MPPTSRHRLLAAALSLAVAVGAASSASAAGAGERFVGLPLDRALQVLQREGVPVVFSSAVVLPSMVVRSAPRAKRARAILDELLRPHGLAVAAGPRGRLVVVRGSSSGEGPERPTPSAPPEPVTAEIVVTAPPESRHGEPVGTTGLAIEGPEGDLPHAGGDAFRAVALLPGAAATESSAQPSVRGGRRDDVMVVLDGLELLAPYHLQEFDSALGIVPTDSLERVELISDPVPVEYGDRLGGVVDMRTRQPEAPLHLSLGVGSLFAEASAGGGFAGGRGSWLGAARSGNYRLALEADGRHEDPRYWDVFGKADYALRPAQSLRLNVLLAGDEFDVDPASVGGGRYRSRWGNSYLWLSHVAGLGANGLAESVAWTSMLDRSRLARQARQGATRFDLDDARTLTLTGGKSVWHWSPAAARWSLDGGVEWREIHSSIDYRAEREGLAPELPGTLPARGSSRFADSFDFDQSAAFASARWRVAPRVTLESGVRWDHIGLTDEAHWSPRIHLAWAPDGASVVRAAWGWFYQSQRSYELQVEDGEKAFWPAERSGQSLLSYERHLGTGASWRIGAYDRRESRPRARFESLFDTAVLYPELAPGRVRLEPEAGRAWGIELLYKSAPRPRFDWSASYTYASVADSIDGRWVPRATDEPHSLELTGGLQLPRKWTLSAAWLYHTGWPTTHVGARLASGEDGDPRVEPALGPIRGDRLPDYHRLDLRFGRGWDLGRGRLSAYLELQNVYARDNARGFEGFRFELDSRGEPVVLADPVSWGSFLPSFGVRWSF